MATLSLESNGLLEKTAVYYNGNQVAGIKELMVILDEDGTFESLIQYEGTDKQIYTKQIFSDYLTNIKTVPPSFTEEDAANLQLFTIESNGDIDDTTILINDENQLGVVRVLLQIKATPAKSNIASFFKKKEIVLEDVTFTAEITYRNDDESIETEDIFL